MRKPHPRHFFTEEEKRRLAEAIREAEKLTSGEIRVHLVPDCRGDPMEEAKSVFERQGMIRTVQRNGILFFLALKDRHFIILGDSGIHEKVREEFWQSIRDEVIGHFKREEFVEGLIAGIRKCGERLAEYFPRRSGDVNELPDTLR